MGTTFYIILKGRLRVYNQQFDIIDENLMNFKQETVLETGKTLGESAILSDVLTPRNISIKALENTFLAVLDRKSYKNVLELEEQKEMEEKIEFLSNIVVFKNWGERSLRSILPYFLVKKWSRKQILYKEGEEVRDIYIIRTGEMKCSKIIDLNSGNNKELILIDDKSHVYIYDQESSQKMIDVIMILIYRFYIKLNLIIKSLIIIIKNTLYLI